MLYYQGHKPAKSLVVNAMEQCVGTVQMLFNRAKPYRRRHK